MSISSLSPIIDEPVGFAPVAAAAAAGFGATVGGFIIGGRALVLGGGLIDGIVVGFIIVGGFIAVGGVATLIGGVDLVGRAIDLGGPTFGGTFVGPTFGGPDFGGPTIGFGGVPFAIGLAATLIAGVGFTVVEEVVAGGAPVNKPIKRSLEDEPVEALILAANWLEDRGAACFGWTPRVCKSVSILVIELIRVLTELFISSIVDLKLSKAS